MSTIDQRFRAFQIVIIYTLKGLVQSSVIATNQNNTNKPPPNAPFTNDHSTSNPTHNQPSNIHSSPIIPQHPHLQFNRITLKTHQLNTPQLLTPHQQYFARTNAS